MTWYSVEDVARIARVHPRTIQRWCRDRRIPHLRVGRCLRFTDQQLAEIETTYSRPALDVVDICVPNPTFSPRAVVVPIATAPKAG